MGFCGIFYGTKSSQAALYWHARMHNYDEYSLQGQLMHWIKKKHTPQQTDEHCEKNIRNFNADKRNANTETCSKHIILRALLSPLSIRTNEKKHEVNM